jgi:hypothetical protein
MERLGIFIARGLIVTQFDQVVRRPLGRRLAVQRGADWILGSARNGGTYRVGFGAHAVNRRDGTVAREEILCRFQLRSFQKVTPVLNPLHR